ncbi:hypothetical protein EV44_g3357 [Erysiphe necator]|uniref:Uncharacterized protein n=1 Tax=Uncinula necator TaxID=52586 RepID=A0A0B1P362_UNCNE|nr:hypothetical protein EV44_g3357 [Erysiphe necator]
MTLKKNLQDDSFLQNKLLTACQTHPACLIGCSMPATSTNILINNLRLSINNHVAVSRSQEQSQFNQSSDVNTNENNQNYFIDRRYHSNPSYNRNQFSRQNGFSRNKSKRCFICRKEGCWSTRHTADERNKAKSKFDEKFRKSADRRFDQYVAEFEGNPGATSDNSDNDIEALVTEIENFELNDTEMFLTEVGAINKADATLIVNQLFNRSATHALLKNLDNNEEVTITTNPTASFLLESRYGCEMFYGIMIDTGAAGKSTAGYNQYLAYCHLFGKTYIDRSNEGAVNATFGIGSTISIGSITINTPIGECTFHILKTRDRIK